MAISMRDASVYTELSGLQAISQLGRENSTEALREVAKQFEAMFLNIMLKGMRAGEEALFSDNYLRGNEMSFHQENLDNQLALHMSSNGGIGLAETLHRQLMQRYEPSRATDAESKSTLAGDLASARLFVGQPDALPASHGLENAGLAAAEWRLRNITVTPAVAMQSDMVGPERPFLNRRATEQDIPAMPSLVPPAQFDSPEEFVKHLMPIAEKFARELGVDPKVLLAQSALETGWGQKMIRGANGDASFNLFGIKANISWQGERVNVSTLEFRDGAMQREVASFRAYRSYEESFADYVRLMQSQPRYAPALQHASDPSAYTERLQQAGYATDPDYAEKILSVMRSPSLNQASLGGVSAPRVN
ncbi:MAG: flagellar assembly peptidoglycan hydrolase FlgJ [Pseudohongiella sp.]|nr:flagellar assembly peptidoglycan hydrolase FlgJ [Pseudohongiella sp.]MDP2127869.1 flagellar assembly peptidoglycan hydrolase FlgJ [Pseudohongiella sp.]